MSHMDTPQLFQTLGEEYKTWGVRKRKEHFILKMFFLIIPKIRRVLWFPDWDKNLTLLLNVGICTYVNNNWNKDWTQETSQHISSNTNSCHLTSHLFPFQHPSPLLQRIAFKWIFGLEKKGIHNSLPAHHASSKIFQKLCVFNTDEWALACEWPLSKYLTSHYKIMICSR